MAHDAPSSFASLSHRSSGFLLATAGADAADARWPLTKVRAAMADIGLDAYQTDIVVEAYREKRKEAARR